MKTSTYARNSQLDRFSLLANGGFLRIFTGPQPATADASPAKTVQMISEHRLSIPAFGSAYGGQLKSNSISDDPDARISATASWFRVTQMDGSTVLFDGSIGDRDSSADLKMNPQIQARARVIVESITITQPY
mgnify:CR=1 FL=1